MISFFVGTTAELIKMAPVYHELVGRQTRPRLWYTGQHVAGVDDLLKVLGMDEPDFWLARGAHGRTLERSSDVPAWAGTLMTTIWRRRHALSEQLRDGKRPLVLVHGDTFTTPIGAITGRMLRATVGHVEAGLRSGSLRSPFPEEANRRIAGRLADIHFAPTEREVANLAGARGRVVPTHANTVVDAIRLLRARPGDSFDGLPDRYGLATLHRFELLRDAERLREIIDVLLTEATSDCPIVFFAGSHEEQRLRSLGLLQRFDPARLILRPKLPYGDFLQVLARTQFVVTDSGGLQEECAYLGIPCLVHRARTERHQGLTGSVVLSQLDTGVVKRFLTTYPELRATSKVSQYNPSKIIADTLVELGHL